MGWIYTMPVKTRSLNELVKADSEPEESASKRMPGVNPLLSAYSRHGMSQRPASKYKIVKPHNRVKAVKMSVMRKRRVVFIV